MFSSIINEIKNVQEHERYLYNQYELLHNSETSTEHDKKNLDNLLKTLKARREKLFEQLLSYTKNVDDESGDANVNSDVVFVTLVNKELERAEQKLQELDKKKRTVHRKAHLLQYEQKKYKARVDLLQIIALILAIVLILFILQRVFLPRFIVMISVVAVLSIGTIIVLYRLYDMSMRDNFFYDQYRWPINKKLLIESTAT